MLRFEKRKYEEKIIRISQSTGLRTATAKGRKKRARIVPENKVLAKQVLGKWRNCIKFKFSYLPGLVPSSLAYMHFLSRGIFHLW